MTVNLKRSGYLLCIEAWAHDHGTYIAYDTFGNYVIDVPGEFVLEFYILFSGGIDW